MSFDHFRRLMDEFILQVADDTLREQLDLALCRMIHKRTLDEEKELSELGLKSATSDYDPAADHTK